MTYVKSHLEDFIENLYTKISIFTPDQLDIDLIARRLDIEVVYSHKKSKCAQIDGIKMIRINKYLPKAEQWQEFAHEACHLLRHAGNQTELSFPFIQLQEWQAKTFAIHFCIPTFMLENLDLPFRKQWAISKVAHTFGVEYSFAEERLALYEIQMMGVTYGHSPSLL